MRYIASVSFGKDSLAMLLLLIEKGYPLDVVVFFDTGMEFNSIYKVRDKIVPILESKNIKFVQLSPDKPFTYSMIEQKIKYKNKPGYHYGYGWCGGACRWATSYKLRAIKAYKKSLNCQVVDYVGIAADEKDRISKAIQNGKKLPLVELGMNEKDCLQYCYDKGYFWDEDGVELYSILDRVSCWCCRNKNLRELKNMYLYLPGYWKQLRELQSQIDMPFKGEGKSVFELEEKFEKHRDQLCLEDRESLK